MEDLDKFDNEINWGYMLNKFWCGYHNVERVIVFRAGSQFVLTCGCCYGVDEAGVHFLNTTLPINYPPQADGVLVEPRWNITNKRK